MQNIEKKVSCKKCGKRFRNRYVYAGHAKVHIKKAIESISKSRQGNLNPAKRLDVRIKISKAGMGKIPWNKNKRWKKDHRHDKIVTRTAEKLRKMKLRVITTHQYIPDAIIIDFNKKKVKAFELNPRSVISKGMRAKEKGYDSLIIKVRRRDKYRHKNTDKEIPINEFI